MACLTACSQFSSKALFLVVIINHIPRRKEHKPSGQCTLHNERVVKQESAVCICCHLGSNEQWQMQQLLQCPDQCPLLFTRLLESGSSHPEAAYIKSGGNSKQI